MIPGIVQQAPYLAGLYFMIGIVFFLAKRVLLPIRMPSYYKWWDSVSFILSSRDECLIDNISSLNYETVIFFDRQVSFLCRLSAKCDASPCLSMWCITQFLSLNLTDFTLLCWYIEINLSYFMFKGDYQPNRKLYYYLMLSWTLIDLVLWMVSLKSTQVSDWLTGL